MRSWHYIRRAFIGNRADWFAFTVEDRECSIQPVLQIMGVQPPTSQSAKLIREREEAAEGRQLDWVVFDLDDADDGNLSSGP